MYDAVTAAPAFWRNAWAIAPRHLRTRDWAEQHIIILPPSARPGPFRLATNPMLGPVLDLFDHPEVREAAGMKGVQTGVSQAMQIRVARRAHTSPCQMLIVLPSKDAGRQQMKKRWRPVLTGKGCPVLRQFQRRRGGAGQPRKGATPKRERPAAEDTDRTTYDNVVLTNGFDLLLGYSGSVQSLASNSCEEVELDEVDKFNDWDGDEASPTELGRVRTETFQSLYKLNQISTPTTDTGNIAVAFYGSDIRLYSFVPCSKCGRPVQLLFENITWELPPEREIPDQAERARLLIREPQRVWLEGGDCHAKIFEADRLRLLPRGWLGTIDQAWQLRADGREVGKKPWGTTVGYHFPTMASAMGMGLNALAAEWVGAQGSIDRIKKAKTQHHGVPFVLDQVRPAKGLLWPKIHDDAERGFVAPPSWRVPAWASRVFLIVDTQKDKFYWILRAYGRRRRSRLIAYGEARSFEDLERLESLKIENEDPALPSRGIFLTAIDSGGGVDLKRENLTRTRQVYQWCAADPRKRLALKGVTSNKYDTITKLRQAEYQSPTTQEKVRVHLLWVKPLDSGDNLADTIRQQIDAFDPRTGELLVDPETGEARKVDLWELNRDVKGDYVGHLEVMERKQIKKHARLHVRPTRTSRGARTPSRRIGRSSAWLGSAEWSSSARSAKRTSNEDAWDRSQGKRRRPVLPSNRRISRVRIPPRALMRCSVDMATKKTVKTKKAAGPAPGGGGAQEKPRRGGEPMGSRYQLLDVPDVQRLTGWSPMTLERRLLAGKFPAPIERGRKRKWTLAQFEAWAKQREDAAARDAG